MGWPKGKPRRGHVNKDGTPHRKRLPASAYATVSPYLEADPTGSSEYPALHGATGTGPISEVCPKCGYAYADGGYCPDCGWMRPITVHPYGTHQGRRF